MTRKALGRGLGLAALVPTVEQAKEGLIDLSLDHITPNRYQPRQNFDSASLDSLAASLKQYGLIQPITVRKTQGGKYEIIAGERRWRAAKLAGFQRIPAIVKIVDDRELMEWAVLENLQREDLNPIEKAQAYEKLISEFSMTQEAIATRMGIDRSSVSNFLRLLHLPRELWIDISKGRLSMGHAKALLSLESTEDRLALAKEIMHLSLSVRQTEAMTHQIKRQLTPKKVTALTPTPPDLTVLEDRLRLSLGTKVKLVQKGKVGEIRIAYYSLNDLDRILEKIS